MSYKIGIADDHKLLRFALRMLLRDENDYELALEATDGYEILEKIGTANLDLLILDITMPGLDGLEVLRKLRDSRPDLKILILTMHNSRVLLTKALDLGASGYFLKDGDEKGILTAINAIRMGNLYFPDNIQDQEQIQVTKREHQIVKYLETCKNSGEIAEQISRDEGVKISAATLRKHKQNINRKFGTHNRDEILKIAREQGLI